MASERNQVALTPDAAEQVERLRRRMMRAHRSGRLDLPDAACPTSYVLSRSMEQMDRRLDELEAAEAIREGLAQADRGETRPAAEVVDDILRTGR